MMDEHLKNLRNSTNTSKIVYMTENDLKLVDQEENSYNEIINYYNCNNIVLERELKKHRFFLFLDNNETSTIIESSKQRFYNSTGFLYLNNFIRDAKINSKDKYLLVSGSTKIKEILFSRGTGEIEYGPINIRDHHLLKVEKVFHNFDELKDYADNYGLLYDPIINRMNYDTSCRPHRKDHFMNQVRLCKQIDMTIPHNNAVYNFYKHELYESRYRVYVDIYNHKNKQRNIILTAQSNSCLEALREMYRQSCDRLWV